MRRSGVGICNCREHMRLSGSRSKLRTGIALVFCLACGSLPGQPAGESQKSQVCHLRPYHNIEERPPERLIELDGVTEQL